MDDDNTQDYASSVEEYFEIKGTIKTLRDDLKELKENHDDFEELEALNKKVKELRANIKNNEDIRIVEEKLSDLKERQNLLKEIIKVQLVEMNQEEVKQDGRKLKIVQVLKEMKDEGK